MVEQSGSPDVSVIIPTHNRVEYLKKALGCCFKENGDISVEVIVVNDGSTDGTRAFLDQLNNPHVRAIHQSSQGAQVARNTGMESASGQYVKFLDDDDWLLPGALRDEVARLDNTKADACHGWLQRQTEGKETEHHIVQESPGDDIVTTVLAERMWTVPHKYLFRRSSIEDLQWDPDLPYHQDYAYLVEAACRGLQFVELDRVVGVSRWHDGPRIADVKTAATPKDYYTLKVELITRGVDLLKKNNLLEQQHCQAAAEGIWNWAHIVAGYDLEAFEMFYTDIQDIAPGFKPERPQSVLSALDSILGVKETERLLYPLRRVKNVFS